MIRDCKCLDNDIIDILVSALETNIKEATRSRDKTETYLSRHDPVPIITLLERIKNNDVEYYKRELENGDVSHYFDYGRWKSREGQGRYESTYGGFQVRDSLLKRNNISLKDYMNEERARTIKYLETFLEDSTPKFKKYKAQIEELELKIKRSKELLKQVESTPVCDMDQTVREIRNFEKYGMVD